MYWFCMTDKEKCHVCHRNKFWTKLFFNDQFSLWTSLFLHIFSLYYLGIWATCKVFKLFEHLHSFFLVQMFQPSESLLHSGQSEILLKNDAAQDPWVFVNTYMILSNFGNWETCLVVGLMLTVFSDTSDPFRALEILFCWATCVHLWSGKAQLLKS